MNEVVFKTLKEKDFIVKNYLIKVATELKLSLADTLLLIYLTNQETPSLNIKNIASTMYLSPEEIMESYSKLKSLNLLTVEVKKNRNGQIDEIISLDNIIKSITVEMTSKQKEEEQISLYDLFEREFGRPLSPMEFEIINDWEHDGYDRSLIEAALKEAIYNNAKTFRYVSAVLQAWKSKGYKTSKDLNKNIKKESEEKYSEIFEYDWINED